MNLRDRKGFTQSPVKLGIAAVTVAVVLFIAVAQRMMTGDPLVNLDGRLATWLHTHGTTALTQFFLWVSYLNGQAPIIAYATVFAIVLAWKREWYWVMGVALTVFGGLGLNLLLKYVFQRARPEFDIPLVTLETYSFPSGHTAGTVLFYGVLMAFLMSRFKSLRARVTGIVVLILMITLVGFSRMYLGAHYLSDVLAATCSSLAWLGICLISVHAIRERRDRG